MKNRYVLVRQFQAVGYYTIFHALFWISLIINLAAYFGKGAQAGVVQAGTSFVFFMFAIHNLGFSFSRPDEVVIDKAEGIKIKEKDIFFRVRHTNISLEDIAKVHVGKFLLRRKIIFQLKNGKSINVTLETFSTGGKHSPSEITSDFNFENEEFVEVARSLDCRHESSISQLVLKIVESFRNNEKGKLINED